MSVVMSPQSTSVGCFALQTRLFTGMKRAGRIIDVAWFQQDADYARAMLALAEKTGDEGLREVVAGLRDMMRDLLAPVPVETATVMPAMAVLPPVVPVVPVGGSPVQAEILDRYIGRLR